MNTRAIEIVRDKARGRWSVFSFAVSIHFDWSLGDYIRNVRIYLRFLYIQSICRFFIFFSNKNQNKNSANCSGCCGALFILFRMFSFQIQSIDILLFLPKVRSTSIYHSYCHVHNGIVVSLHGLRKIEFRPSIKIAKHNHIHIHICTRLSLSLSFILSLITGWTKA